MKVKINEEREKFKNQIDKLKQNHIKEITEMTQCFTEEIESLQECLASSSFQLNTLDERLKIAEDVMDCRFTNHLNQKFIYQAKLKELEELRSTNSPHTLLYDKYILENNRYQMVIEDLNAQVIQLSNKISELNDSLYISEDKNLKIPILIQQIKLLNDRLGLYSGRKTQSELKHKGPHLFSIYQDIVKIHGNSVKEIMKNRKNNKNKSSKGVSISVNSNRNLQGDFKSTIENIENMLDGKEKLSASFYGFVDRTVKSKPKNPTNDQSKLPENKSSPKKASIKKETDKFMVNEDEDIPKYKVRPKQKNKKEDTHQKLIERTKYETYNPQLIRHITMKF